MSLDSIRSILKTRDDMDDEDINEMFKDAKQQFEDGADPEEILLNDFGLEPDYVFDLMEEIENVEDDENTDN